MTIRLVENGPLEEKLIEAHRAGAAFFAALMLLEADMNYNLARDVEKIALNIGNVMGDVVKLVEEKEDGPHEPGRL